MNGYHFAFTHRVQVQIEASAKLSELLEMVEQCSLEGRALTVPSLGELEQGHTERVLQVYFWHKFGIGNPTPRKWDNDILYYNFNSRPGYTKLYAIRHFHLEGVYFV